MNIKKIAHVKQGEDGAWLPPHFLMDHLQGVAEKARLFSSAFSSGNWGYAAGLAHDVGKEPEKWQAYLCLKSGYDKEAHLEGLVGKLEHSCHGAKLAEEVFGKSVGRVIGYCVAGHHAGLPDWFPDEKSSQSSLKFRLQKTTTDELSKNLKELIKQVNPGSPPWPFDLINELDLSLWIRLLFSSLVDADFLDTEAFMDERKTQQRGGYLEMGSLLHRFNEFIVGKTAACTKTPLNVIRHEILNECRAAAKFDQGYFSLTVPTGGGKTLSSLAFALEHAVTHNLRRIIYVIPYTSIIEQNADVFRDAIGDDQVIEHHCNLDENNFSYKARLAAENWDAPVIVTTSVQFFESLFASKPSRCRKLHNIVGSVVVLDEAQLMPAQYLMPILQTMELLRQRYQVTFVISTATQPAFEQRSGFEKGLPKDSIREIINDVPALYKSLKRVAVELPKDWLNAVAWEDLTKDLCKEERVLCVVSDRKSCRSLHKLMPEGTFHLSALMCGQHRSDIIAEIKNQLCSDEPVRVISTQLVEAGVDIDFPVVYRALAGLDSIAQAAGRCNREGKLGGKGRVVVFIPPKKSPPGILRKAADSTAIMLKEGLPDPLDHSVFERFFSELYWKVNSLDEQGIVDLLKPNHDELGIQFRSAAEKFCIIDDKAQKTVLVRYREGVRLIDKLKVNGPERWLLRKLQRYSVRIYNRDFFMLQKLGCIEEVSPDTGIYAVTTELQYDKIRGLLVDEVPDDPDLFIL